MSDLFNICDWHEHIGNATWGMDILVSAMNGHILSSAVTMNTGSSGCFFWMAFQASSTAFVSSPTCSARPVTGQRAMST